MMPIGDPRDVYFYPTFTLIADSYIPDRHLTISRQEYLKSFLSFYDAAVNPRTHAQIQRMGAGESVRKNKTTRFLGKTGPDPPKNHKATYHSMLNHHRAASETQFNDGPLMVVIGSPLPSSTKKNVVRVGPPLTKLSGFVHGILYTTIDRL